MQFPLLPPLTRIDDWRDELDAAGVELAIPTWAKIDFSTACHLHCAHCYIPAPERSLILPMMVESPV